jgi:hypothetical protein
MDKISTNKLLLYLFNETEMTDSVVVQHAIDTNYYVAEEFRDITNTLNHLDVLMSEPKKSTIENIMAYSRSLKLQ